MCSECTPICQKQGCPRIGRTLHRSGEPDFFSIKNGADKVKITRFACTPDKADQHGSYHYEYRGPHGEEAVRIPAANDQGLRKEPICWGRFRFTDRDTGLAVETEYDPKNAERSANVSAAQAASWKNPKVARRHKRALGAREVQERRVASLRNTVSVRNARIVQDREELADLREKLRGQAGTSSKGLGSKGPRKETSLRIDMVAAAKLQGLDGKQVYSDFLFKGLASDQYTRYYGFCSEYRKEIESAKTSIPDGQASAIFDQARRSLHELLKAKTVYRN